MGTCAVRHDTCRSGLCGEAAAESGASVLSKQHGCRAVALAPSGRRHMALTPPADTEFTPSDQ